MDITEILNSNQVNSDLKDRILYDIFNSYFNKGFGAVAKSELDRIMFHYYYQIKKDSNSDDSDFTISHELKITQQRVRSFKLKDKLFYPECYDGQTIKKEFADNLTNARYDETSKMLIIPVADPCVFEEIQHAIEKKGGYLDLTLNSKILKTRIEYIIDYIIQNELKISNDEFIKELKTKHRIEIKNDNSISSNYNYGNIIKDIDTLTTFVDILKDFVDPKNIIFNAIKSFFKK